RFFLICFQLVFFLEVLFLNSWLLYSLSVFSQFFPQDLAEPVFPDHNRFFIGQDSLDNIIRQAVIPAFIIIIQFLYNSLLLLTLGTQSQENPLLSDVHLLPPHICYFRLSS